MFLDDSNTIQKWTAAVTRPVLAWLKEITGYSDSSKEVTDPGILAVMAEYYEAYKKQTAILLAVMGGIGILCIVAAWSFKGPDPALTWQYRAFLTCLGLAMATVACGLLLDDSANVVAGLLSLPILLPLVPISAVFSVLGILGFGVGTGLLAFFYEVSVESSPVGSWEICLLPPLRTGLIYHSQIYESDEAHRMIQNWIRSRTSQGDGTKKPLADSPATK